MALYDIKPQFRQVLGRVLPVLKPIHPDVLTWTALGCSVASAVLISFAKMNRWLFILIPFLLFLRIALNALDGLLAQTTGKARPFGEVLNEATDRLSDLAILLGIAYSPFSSVRWGMPAVAAVFFSSYIGILGKAVGAGRQYGGILGKADRMLWCGVTCLVAFFIGNTTLFHLPGGHSVELFDGLLALFALLACITAVQRVVAIHTILSRLGR
jgi:phosphatidylglycerophosphate synthase